MEKWNAQLVHGMEADDALAMAQCAEFFCDENYESGDSIIVTIDKDLQMIPGKHYNFVKDTETYVDPRDGLRFFWEQLLIGDKADNIIGIAGIGPIKAQRALQNATTEDKMFEVVRSIYQDDERLLMNARCLWMCREEPDEWRKTKYAIALGVRPEPLEQ
jgi:DNA polymerase-1